MTDMPKQSGPVDLSDGDLEQATGGATWGQGTIRQPTIGKDGVLIQNIGFPDTGKSEK